MRSVLLLTIIFISSCGNKKQTITDRQQAIRKEMEELKTFYYKQADSLQSVKEADTSSARQSEIAEELVLAEREKNARLIPLQKEYDSLEAELKK